MVGVLLGMLIIPSPIPVLTIVISHSRKEIKMMSEISTNILQVTEMKTTKLQLSQEWATVDIYTMYMISSGSKAAYAAYLVNFFQNLHFESFLVF